jgi:hypothetical protein
MGGLIGGKDNAFYILGVTGATRIFVGWVINPPPLEREQY